MILGLRGSLGNKQELLRHNLKVSEREYELLERGDRLSIGRSTKLSAVG